MQYHITLVNLTTHTLDLPIQDTATWEDFENLSAVRALGHKVLDVTPVGMPDRFTDEEMLTNQLTRFGIKRTRRADGLSEYGEIDQENA